MEHRDRAEKRVNRLVNHFHALRSMATSPPAHDADAAPLAAHLRLLSLPTPLVTLLLSLCDACTSISAMLRHTQVSSVCTSNAFGDNQLTVDVSSDAIVLEALRGSGVCCVASSEEQPIEISLLPPSRSPSSSVYSVSFDPLDGSSIIGANLSVGSIFAVWRGSGVSGRHGSELVASMVAIYGPRTTAVIAVNGHCINSTLSAIGDWLVTDSSLRIQPDAKTFAPANLRASVDLPHYSALVHHYLNNRYTLRYSGGLVPDINHMLVKGEGVYLSPVSKNAKAKLRLMYEVFAIAMIVENAGGMAVTETGARVLELRSESLEHRTGLVCGSVNEVQRYIQSLETP